MTGEFMIRVRKIKTISLAKTMGMINLYLGLLVGALISLTGFFDPSALEDLGNLGMFGIASILVLPLLYGIGGFSLGFMISLAYNWTAGLTGGLIIELEEGSE